jgi:hypothetical protein
LESPKTSDGKNDGGTVQADSRDGAAWLTVSSFFAIEFLAELFNGLEEQKTKKRK